MTVLNVPNFSEKSNENLDLPLIERDGVKLVDSRTIAEALGLEHESLMKNVSTSQDAIEKGFGSIRFEIGSTTPNNPKPPKFALLTEDQALFVGTLSRNNEKVVEFKARLIQTFQRIRHAGSYITQASKDDLLKELKSEVAGMFAPVLQEFNDLLSNVESKEAVAAQELLTPVEVSKRLGLSISTLRNWRYLKIGPKATLIGRLVRYTEKDVLNFVEESKKTPVEEPIREMSPLALKLQERKKTLQECGLKAVDRFRMMFLEEQLSSKNDMRVSWSDIMTLALDALEQSLVNGNPAQSVTESDKVKFIT